MQTIALANQKGSVGKILTATNLAIALSRQGKRVLLIDADAQDNLAQLLGREQPDELNPTLATIMGKIITGQPFTPIPRSIRAAEISLEHKSIFEHDKDRRVAKSYSAFTQEVLKLGKQRQKHEFDLSR